MLPQLVQHNVINHRDVGVNKAVEFGKNYHVQRKVILEVRLRRALLCDNLGHHAGDEVNVADSTLRYRSGYLDKSPVPMTSLLTICIIM